MSATRGFRLLLTSALALTMLPSLGLAQAKPGEAASTGTAGTMLIQVRAQDGGFLPEAIHVLPLTSGLPGAALLTFLSFGLAVSLLMLVTTLLVGFSRTALIERLRTSVVWVRRVSGMVLILAGLYQGYYFVVAGM